jgi:WD40 repeat protein
MQRTVRVLFGNTPTSTLYSLATTVSRIPCHSCVENVLVWDGESEECMRILPGHTDHVYGVASCPTDPDLFVSYGADRTCIVWRVSGSVTASWPQLRDHYELVLLTWCFHVVENPAARTAGGRALVTSIRLYTTKVLVVLQRNRPTVRLRN